MSKTKKVQYREYDDDEQQSKKRKHARHATNHKGKGMRVINSYVEEDFDDSDDYIDDEDDNESFSKTQHTFIHKIYRNTI